MIELVEAWARWTSKPAGKGLRDDLEARNRLAEEYYPLTQRVAGKMAKMLPHHVEREDIVSMGTLGMFRALEHYEPSKNVPFETYCTSSVRSLVLDELRKVDWAPRSLRRKQRDLDGARSTLESRLGREPTNNELAAELGVAEDQVRDTMIRVEQAHHVSLEERVSKAPEQSFASASPEQPDEIVSGESKVWQFASKMISTLTAQEQCILALTYIRGLKNPDIAALLGLSEQKVAAIHSEVVLEIREALGNARIAWE